MVTKLQKEIRREVEIDAEPFTVTISPTGVRITRKRFRSGRALSWRALWQGATEEPGAKEQNSSGSPDR